MSDPGERSDLVGVAERLDELGDTAELMGDSDGAAQWRERAAATRLTAMRRLDDAPTFLLIPGAGGDAWYWHRLVDELAERGRAAIAVDLPADDPTAGLARYVDAAVRAAHDLDQVIVVGQSMGGLTAPLLCDPLPVVELVLLNAMIPRPGETGAQWGAETGHEMPADFDPAEHFFHDVAADITAVGLAGGTEQHDRPFADAWPLPEWPDIPTRVIAGRDDRFFPVEFQRRIARDRLGIEPETLPGGHLVALSRPGELADLLIRRSSTPTTSGT